MAQTLKKVRADAMKLPLDERSQLIDDLVEVTVVESTDAERDWIDGILMSREQGPFIRIDDPETYFEARSRRIDERIDRIAAGKPAHG